MTIAITHQFVSAKADGVDVTLVQPSNWGTAATNASNSTHSISMATARLLGRSTAGAGAVEEIDVTNATQRANVGFGGLAVKTTILTADITDANVTLAKLANVSATSRLIGRASAGAGVPEEITIGAGLALSGTTLTAAAAPPGAFKNLSIKVASNTTVTCAADFICVTDGSTFQTLAFSNTLDLGSNGAVNKLDAGTIAIDTWYAVWAIAKADGTAGWLASTSFTAPTLPSGYTFKARVGAVQTIHGTATLYGTWQLGRRAQYVVGLAQTTAMPIMGNANVGVSSWTAIALARFVPTTAGEIVVTASLPNTNSSIAVAPNSSYGNIASITNPPPLALNAGAGSFAATANILLESTNIYYQSSSTGNGVFALGWVDNI